MKFWKKTIHDNLTFEQAKQKMKNDSSNIVITRPCWDGVHFLNRNGKYCILLKDGTIITDKDDSGEIAWNKDSNDWMTVTLSLPGIFRLKTVHLL